MQTYKPEPHRDGDTWTQASSSKKRRCWVCTQKRPQMVSDSAWTEGPATLRPKRGYPHWSSSGHKGGESCCEISFICKENIDDLRTKWQKSTVQSLLSKSAGPHQSWTCLRSVHLLVLGPESVALDTPRCNQGSSVGLGMADYSGLPRSYGELTDCTRNVAEKLGCFWPNTEVDRFFVTVHRHYFSICALSGRAVQDPSSGILCPFIVVPIMVTLLVTALVVWRSKRTEGIV